MCWVWSYLGHDGCCGFWMSSVGCCCFPLERFQFKRESDILQQFDNELLLYKLQFLTNRISRNQTKVLVGNGLSSLENVQSEDVSSRDCCLVPGVHKQCQICHSNEKTQQRFIWCSQLIIELKHFKTLQWVRVTKCKVYNTPIVPNFKSN